VPFQLFGVLVRGLLAAQTDGRPDLLHARRHLESRISPRARWRSISSLLSQFYRATYTPHNAASIPLQRSLIDYKHLFVVQ
jgi:hypothetical protein